MKILVIPDIHGRGFWREPIEKYLDEVDKIIFLGDYLDPYTDEGDESPTFTQALKYLDEIIELKKQHPKKIVLLLGNHCEHYRNKQFREIAKSTRFNSFMFLDAEERFNGENYSLFQLCHIIKHKGKRVIFSHAGISAFWLRYICGFKVDDKLEENINSLENTAKGIERLAVIGRERSWLGDKTGSILWCDLREIMADKKIGKDVMQIFGHTRLKKGAIAKDYNLNCIDSKTAFILDDDLNLSPIEEEKSQAFA